jgi:hypothetical protein
MTAPYGNAARRRKGGRLGEYELMADRDLTLDEAAELGRFTKPAMERLGVE